MSDHHVRWDSHQSLLQDAANATLWLETLRRNCVRCNNRKRWCKRTHQKRCKTFAMMDASNTVQILVACVMQGIRFSSINCLRWGGTKETGIQLKVCAIYNIRFTRMNCLWLGNTKETVSKIKVCAIHGMQFTWMNCLRWDKRTKMVQLNKMCVIRDKQVRSQKCVRRPTITQTIAANKPCDLLCLRLLLTPSRAGREQSAPRPPQPRATKRIEQLNTQKMVVYKLAGNCDAA